MWSRKQTATGLFRPSYLRIRNTYIINIHKKQYWINCFMWIGGFVIRRGILIFGELLILPKYCQTIWYKWKCLKLSESMIHTHIKLSFTENIKFQKVIIYNLRIKRDKHEKKNLWIRVTRCIKVTKIMKLQKAIINKLCMQKKSTCVTRNSWYKNH